MKYGRQLTSKLTHEKMTVKLGARIRELMNW
jgi:hypothetical protein